MKENAYLNMELLRFTTAGSVDDGKSTLIGRLLYDSKSIFEDQMESVKKSSLNRGYDKINLALLTDGLRAERDQGITIDVAYRYFATPKRKFIIADTPGHFQYTRNMVTGASSANLAIILIDSRKGMVEQTKRHIFLASLLGIPHLVICINKMDLVDFSQDIFEKIKREVQVFSSKLNIQDMQFIPISALHGDNVVDNSDNMPWYKGTTLMYLLETIHIGSDLNLVDSRFPVQYVIRPQSEKYQDYRGYSGSIAGGIFRAGDKVMVLPSKQITQIKAIDTPIGSTKEAYTPMSVTLRLEDELDVSRGDMIVRENNIPEISQEIDVMICWMSNDYMKPNGRYILKHTTREAKCIIKEIYYKIDINTLRRIEDFESIGANDISKVCLKITQPIFFDKYRLNRITGSLILIDEATNNTVGAGMIL